MAYLGPQGFDPNTVEPAQDFAPIPSGEYVAIITDSDLKPTKNGSGEYLELTHQVIEGEFKGRLVWGRLNIRNANEVAQRIAQQQLSAICHALGMTQAIQDSAQLHNQPLIIRVEFVPEDHDRGYRAKNEIKAWKACAGASAPMTMAPAHSSAPASAAQSAQAQSALPPWKAGLR